MALTNGLIVMTPTTRDITGAGASATINSNGSTTFSSCATLSLNGVFTANYSNYMIVMRGNNTALQDVNFRLRVSGTDESSATNYYTSQYIQSASATTTYARSTLTFGQFAFWGSTQRAGVVGYMWGPFLAQPTAWRSTGMQDTTSATLYDVGGTHALSTSYTGITFIFNSTTGNGLVSIYGFNE